MQATIIRTEVRRTTKSNGQPGMQEAQPCVCAKGGKINRVTRRPLVCGQYVVFNGLPAVETEAGLVTTQCAILLGWIQAEDVPAEE